MAHENGNMSICTTIKCLQSLFVEETRTYTSNTAEYDELRKPPLVATNVLFGAVSKFLVAFFIM